MKAVTWRNAALVLGAICCYQRWQSCSAPDAPSSTTVAAQAECPPPASSSGVGAPPSRAGHAAPEAASKGRSFYGFTIPAWALRLAPQPGESMREFRDRVLPLAQAAVIPQRRRVARMRDDLALDARQLAELDVAANEAAAAIEDRVRSAIASGELRPATFKPMAGVAIAREVFDIVDRGNARFVGALTAEQRARLASQRFDFADYLLFSAHWEDAFR